jgi:diacylglycerol kinase (ATP)
MNSNLSESPAIETPRGQPAAARVHLPADPRRAPKRAARRSAWRQRLIEAESGIRLGLRVDGTLFVHLFVMSGILAAGAVLGLGTLQWALLVLALTGVLTAELFHQMLRMLWKEAGHHLPPHVRNAARIGTAAVVMSSVGAIVVLVMLFAQRIVHLRGG